MTIDLLLHGLSRPASQIQLLLILFAWLGWWWMERKLPTRNQWVQALAGPLSVAFLMRVVAVVVRASGLPSGLMAIGWQFPLLVAACRLVLVPLDILVGGDLVQAWRRRMLQPLLAVIAVLWWVSQLVPPRLLAAVELMQPFGVVITLGTAVAITVGLGLWIVFLDLLEQTVLAALPRAGQQPRGRLRAQLTITRYALILVGAVAVVGRLEVSPAALAAISGGLSVGIGFSLKEVVANVISGIALLFEGSIRPGDVVELDGEPVVVDAVSLRATKVTTLDRVEKIVPNAELFSSTINTMTGTDHVVRVQVPISISYDDDPGAVCGLLMQIAREEQSVLSKPPPKTYLIDYGDSGIELRMDVWTDQPLSRLSLRSELYAAIGEKFDKLGIRIPFPQRDLHIRSQGGRGATS